MIDVVCKNIKPVPIDLIIHYADGHNENIHRSVGVWEKSSKVTIPAAGAGVIQQVTLAGTFDVDRDKKDNVFIVQ